MKQNNYLINYQKKDYRIQLVFPAYKAFNGDLGYSWDLGISVSTGKYARFQVRIGLLFGWLEVVRYKKED